MPLREFVDAEGKRWQVWQIQPRTIAPSYTGPERRQNAVSDFVPERRSAASSRRLLTPELDGGWLCFMADEEKRRLIPIPEDWEWCSEEALEAYCAAARGVPPAGAPPTLPTPEQP